MLMSEPSLAVKLKLLPSNCISHLTSMGQQGNVMPLAFPSIFQSDVTSDAVWTCSVWWLSNNDNGVVPLRAVYIVSTITIPALYKEVWIIMTRGFVYCYLLLIWQECKTQKKHDCKHIKVPKQCCVEYEAKYTLARHMQTLHNLLTLFINQMK